METLWAGDARCLQFDCVVQCLGFVLGPGQVPKPCFFCSEQACGVDVLNYHFVPSFW